MKDAFLSRPHSLEEVAQWLGCTVKFLRKEIGSGHLRARKLGKRFIRIMPSDLKMWLDEAATIAIQEGSS